MQEIQLNSIQEKKYIVSEVNKLARNYTEELIYLGFPIIHLVLSVQEKNKKGDIN